MDNRTAFNINHKERNTDLKATEWIRLLRLERDTGFARPKPLRKCLPSKFVEKSDIDEPGGTWVYNNRTKRS